MLVTLLILSSIILVVLKLAGVLAIGWLLALLPALVGLGFILVVLVGLFGLVAAMTQRSSRF